MERHLCELADAVVACRVLTTREQAQLFRLESDELKAKELASQLLPGRQYLVQDYDA